MDRILITEVEVYSDTPFVEDQRERIQKLIDLASLRLIARIPSIPDRVASGDLDRELVVGVVADVVLRIIRNPDGYESVSESEGPYSGTYRWSGGDKVWIRDSDIRDLLPKRTRRYGSIQLGVSGWQR